MAENTLQFSWIVRLKENFDALLPDFVAGDLLWYPVEGDPKIRQAPDVLIALGRPKGDRGSYKQWEEQGVAPQVVIEVLSPGNTPAEMKRKLDFYERFGVAEYIVFDPFRPSLEVFVAEGGHLYEVSTAGGWTSPRTGARFVLGQDLEVFGPDGQRFESFAENRARAEAEAARASSEAARASSEAARAAAAVRALEEQKARADALEAQLRALGVAVTDPSR